MNTASIPFTPAINRSSRVPKYLQLASYILKEIEKEHFKIGEKLPTISDLQNQTGFARDTVLKSYKYLCEKRILTSVCSKGFYLIRKISLDKVNVLIVINKLSTYKVNIYNLLVDAFGENYELDLKVHHCSTVLLKEIIEENKNAYDYLIVMPHFTEKSKLDFDIINYFETIPKEKLLFMDKYLPELENSFPCIYQDFELDIFEALSEGLSKLINYNKLVLIFPENANYPYPPEIKKGFRDFCIKNFCDYEIIPEVPEKIEFAYRDVYIIIDEDHLIYFLQQIKKFNLRLGADVGVVSYNDTPLKEVLGISVLSTDFEVMADSAAYMIKKKKKEVVSNYFSLIDRGSF